MLPKIDAFLKSLTHLPKGSWLHGLFENDDVVNQVGCPKFGGASTVYIILNVEGVVVMLLKECQWPTFFHSFLSMCVCYMC